MELCLDTSTVATISLVEDGEVLSQVTDPNPRRHAEGLGVLLTQCFHKAGIEGPIARVGIDRIVVGTGPGPYTALRAGLAFAAALGRGLGVPAWGVGSLDAWGRQALDEVPGPVLILTDAKRKEVYYAVYDADGADGVSALVGPQVGPIEEALAQGEGAPVFFAGLRPPHLTDTLEKTGARSLVPYSASLTRVASARAAIEPAPSFSRDPLYLRRPDIHHKGT